MIEQILHMLQKTEIRDYQISETRTESVESFFIRRKLDLKRRTDLTEYTVTVYRPFEKEGQCMFGASAVQIYPDMAEEEVEDSLRSAYHAASFVCNPFYELYQGEKAPMIPSASGFAGHTLEENSKQMSEALFAADTQETVFINSAEVFARRMEKRILNSRGVDVSFEIREVSGEYVIQCMEGQDVETYHDFSYREPDTEGLRRNVEEALAMTRARAQAIQAPKAGEYRVILSGKQMRTMFSYYLYRAESSMIYQKYSNYQVGMPVQGEKITGDALTITLTARDPYSPEGIPMKDRVLLQDGTLQMIQGGSRFAQYLGIEPTGFYESISVPEGKISLEEMKKSPYLHIVSFSDFQMDDFTGHFGGEIRLAFLYDGETVMPVTGGSVNGSILEVQENMTFSKERYTDGKYDGPFAVCLEGVKVAGT